ncbi:MAG: PAS domain S-box protein, partial [Deltaproteobacteria bacterium]|nr:PAS domain S-box protein [Deltaproteobacteria bacterium]
MKNKCLGKKCELNGFAVLDRVMVGAFVLGRDFKVLFWNRTLEDWTGVSKDKIVGADVAEYFPELKQPRYKHRIEDIFNGAPPAIFSPQLHGNFMPSKFSDGTNLVKRVTVSLVRINVTGGDEYEDNALFVMQDVSELTRRVSEYRLMHERVEKELALRKEAEGEVRKLSRAVEQSPATVVITDLDGRIEYVNPEFTRITGYSQEEVIGGNPQILKSGHTTDEEYKELWETITSGEIWEGEFLNVKKDGGHYWESAHIAPVKDDSGTITHFVAVKLDITERKKTEEVLKKTLNQQSVLNGVLATALKDISLEKQLELVLEKLFDLPWLPVLKRGCIFLVEESGTLTMKAHRGFSDSILNTCARIPFGKCLCGRAAESGKIVFAEAIDDRHEITYEGITPHGHYCVPIRSGENVLGVINLYVGEGHKWDEGEKKFLISIANTLAGIIEKKTAEEALRAAREEAEKATRTKDKFVALVSHDLKGPLHVIRGYLDMLKEGGLEPEVTKEMVLEAMSTCDDMNRFIKDILNLGRIKGGEIRPDRH